MHERERYEGDAFDLRSCDVALYFHRRATGRMNGRWPGFAARLRAMLARREPEATVCECGELLDGTLDMARVTVQAGRRCRRCEAGR